MEHKHIIIILLAIIVILAAGIGVLLLNQNAKQPSQVIITTDNEQYEGGQLSIQLTDLNETPISKDIVNITITNKKGSVVVDDVVKTNSKGKAKLDLNLKKGEYDVNVAYGGNENYTGSNTTQVLTIKEKETVTAEITSTQSSSGNQYDINNLPPSNDPNPETRRFYIDENHVRQEYSDNYYSIVDLRTGERHGAWF